jgi:hypothetical protein
MKGRLLPPGKAFIHRHFRAVVEGWRHFLETPVWGGIFWINFLHSKKAVNSDAKRSHFYVKTPMLLMQK